MKPQVSVEGRMSWSRRRRIKIRLFTFARFWVLPLFRLLFGLRIEGLEHVPKAGPALIVSNHLHNVDPILLETVVPRPVLFMAKKEVFGVPVVSRLARFCGAFPVDRGSADRAALRNSERLLAEGMLVGLFPEGTRSTTGGLATPFPGVGMIALRSGAPILPIAIFGTESLPFNGKKGRRPRTGRRSVVVRIGRPFHLPSLNDNGSRPDITQATERIMLGIAALLPEQYRGVYRDRVPESATSSTVAQIESVAS